MASKEKHKQRSARSYHKRSAEARSFARYVWWKNADVRGKKKTRKSLKDRAKDLIKKMFSRQKKGAQK